MKLKPIVDDFIQTYGLEFFATDHCNLNCSGCSQCSPFLKKHFADILIFEKSLKTLRKYLRPNKITILGGEPLQHPDIDSIISIARRANMFNKIHITTNGLHLLKMSSAFWSTIDVLRISKYPANSEFINKHYEEFRHISMSNKVELQIREMNSFNRIVLTEKNTKQELVEDIYNKCIYKYYCHTLSEDKIFRCSPVVNISKYHIAIGKGNTRSDDDFIEIKDSINFKNQLFKYLNSEIPLKSCEYCLGSSGKEFSHTQATKSEIINPISYGISNESY